jgi:hypothetical protein
MLNGKELQALGGACSVLLHRHAVQGQYKGVRKTGWKCVNNGGDFAVARVVQSSVQKLW